MTGRPKNQAIIADQARMRRDLRELHVLDDDIAQLQCSVLIVPILPPTAPHFVVDSTNYFVEHGAVLLAALRLWAEPRQTA